jgi:septum formation protein
VLASSSPRRQELLRNAGVKFLLCPAHIPEVPGRDESPRAFSERMAKEKARAVRLTMPDNTVLAADTVVSVDRELLLKPRDARDAVRMLRLLSGRKHLVTTGVCLIGDGFEDVHSETTEVEFRRLGEEEIQEYVESGEPMDKAGAYAIQGGAARWISKIEGDYSNVVGLPVGLVRRMLAEHCAV